MKVYDANYNQFIPKWWELPIKIGSRFCNLMGETLDDQLTRFPENSDAIRAAKIKCEKFEEELIENAMRRICSLELDVRSWCKWDAGDPVSYNIECLVFG
ncbi:MAG: hypothetical protein GY941_18460 [Planctomycetes bacterium]|nr:hypothetical protein [Planctomycetota bacterium]